MRADEPIEEQDSDESTTVVTVTPSAVQLRKWLAKKPRAATALVLMAKVDGGQPEQLASWPEEEGVPALAPEVIAALREYVQATKLDASARLAWHAASGAEIGSAKVMGAELARPPATNFGSAPGELNGTTNSLVIQMQKHLEVMMRAHHTNTTATLHQSRQLTEHAVELANAASSARAEAEERAENMRRERDELREQLDEVLTVVQSDNPEEAQTAAHQASIMKIFENPGVQMAIMRMLGGGGAPPVPPQAPPS